MLVSAYTVSFESVFFRRCRLSPFVDRNPAVADVFLSCSGDTTVRIWDLRHAGPTLVLPAHAFEVLTAGGCVDEIRDPLPKSHFSALPTDWCKYNDCIIATGSVDKTIKIWDVRMPQRELTVLLGHG